jgi:hypothetical protein
MKRSAKQELLRSTVDDVISQNREAPMTYAPTIWKMVSMENECSRGSLINIPPHVRALEAVLSRNAKAPFRRPSFDVCSGKAKKRQNPWIKCKVPTKPDECDGGGPAKKQSRPPTVDEFANRNYVKPQDQAASAATSPSSNERQRVVCGHDYVVTPIREVGCTVNEIDSALPDYKKMSAEEKADVARRKNDT